MLDLLLQTISGAIGGGGFESSINVNDHDAPTPMVSAKAVNQLGVNYTT